MAASRSRPAGRPPRRPPAADPTRALAATVAAVLATAAALAQTADPLALPVSALWSAVPLRTWAERAGDLASRPVVVDRRLDPGLTVTRACRGETLETALVAVASAAGAAVEPLASSIRLVPAAVAGRAAHGERVRTAEIAALPAAARTTLAVRRPWSWPDGARPRDLVAAAAAEANATLDGLEAVPHDHLPAATLAPLSLAERLDLVLAHYDLRAAWTAAAGGLAGRVVPLGAAPAGAAPERTRPAAAPRRPPPGTAERHTLELEAPLDAAVAALAAHLGLEPDLDRAALAARGILPGEVVRAQVTGATRAELLDAVVAPLGLRWRIEGRRLVVDAPPP